MSTADVIVIVVVVVFAISGYFIWDRRYRGGAVGTFQPTNEVFKDPTTGRMTRVYEDPVTGKRQYKDDP